MLSFLDPILFPDEIEVLEVSPGRYIYPIFKNGSRTLIDGEGFRQLSKGEILNLKHTDVVEVFVREPFDRFISGVQTYLRFHPELDRITTLSIINRYLFLDRHFNLQFHWLINLNRFCNTLIYIRPLSDLSSTTDLVWNTISRDQSLVDYFQPNLKLWYYLQLDKILTEDLVGQTIKIPTIVSHIKNRYPDLYNEVILRSKYICGALD